MREGRNSAVQKVSQDELYELQTKLMHVSGLAGLFYPLDATDVFLVNNQPQGGNLPVPPQSLWHGYGKTEEEYLASGRHNASVFNECFEKHHPPLGVGENLLDFGCSAGRMVRFFEEHARRGVNVWGCDIDSASIEWCQRNLMPPIRFFMNTTTPHLPLRDKSFDFIYAGSVFSHMSELSTAWLLELGRCTATGGICIFTIHSELTLEYLMQFESQPEHRYSKTARVLKSWGLNTPTLNERGHMFFESSVWWLSAWFSIDYFCRLASLSYEIVDIVPEMYGYQTAVVLRGK